MHTVEALFARSEPHVRSIYERLLAEAHKLGPLEVEPKKTSIHLVRRTAFAGVATRKSALVITLKSAADVDSPRIVKHQHTSAHRWYLDVKLDSAADVDTELIGWLSAAYDLAG